MTDLGLHKKELKAAKPRGTHVRDKDTQGICPDACHFPSPRPPRKHILPDWCADVSALASIGFPTYEQMFFQLRA